MDAHQLTPMQIELLKMFNFCHSDEFAKELKLVIGDYLQKKIDEEFNRMNETGEFTRATLESLRNVDFHSEKRLKNG